MKTRLLLLLALGGLAAPSLPAWDKPGHSVVAVIALKELEKTNPNVALAVARILKQSEDYSAYNQWSASITHSTLPPAGDRETEMLFILGARWPDDIKADGTGRDKSPHDTHPWHYINLPIGPNATGHTARTPNILTALQDLGTQWKAASTDAQRAPILCFFLHFIGDSHQPLHSSNFFGPTFLGGDAGGEDWAIHAEGKATKLHAFWDNVLIVGDDAAATAKDVDALAKELTTKYPRSAFPQIGQNKDVPSWMQKETLSLALKYGYLDGQLPVPVSGSPTRLSDDYKKNALEVARRQVALAGYRLADVLVALVGAIGHDGH